MLYCKYVPTLSPWWWASELNSTFDMKKPVVCSCPPRSEKPKAGADLRGRTSLTTRTRRSPAAPTREDVVVDVVDAAYMAQLLENTRRYVGSFQ